MTTWAWLGREKIFGSNEKLLKKCLETFGMILLKLPSFGLISLSSPQHSPFSASLELKPFSCSPPLSGPLISPLSGKQDLATQTVHIGVTEPSRQAGPGKAHTLRVVWEWLMGHPQGAQTLVLGRPLVFILAKGHPLSLCAKQLSSQPALLAQLIPLSQEANRPSKEGC